MVTEGVETKRDERYEAPQTQAPEEARASSGTWGGEAEPAVAAEAPAAHGARQHDAVVRPACGEVTGRRR